MTNYIQQIEQAGQDPRYPMTSFAAEVARQTVLVSEQIPDHYNIVENGVIVGRVEIPQAEQARMYAEAVTLNTQATIQAIGRIEGYRDLCLWESANNSQAVTAEFAARLYAPKPAGFISDRQRGVWDATSVLIAMLLFGLVVYIGVMFR